MVENVLRGGRDLCGGIVRSVSLIDLLIPGWLFSGSGAFESQLVHDLFVQEQAYESHRSFILRKECVGVNVLLHMLAQVRHG